MFVLGDALNEYLENEINNSDYHPNILDFFPDPITQINDQYMIEEKFVYKGIMEDYQDCINRLAEKLRFEYVDIRHINKSERYKIISGDLREEYIKTHPFEYCIYNYVLDNYKKW